MKILEHTNKIELLKLYKMDSSICPNLSIWFDMRTHKYKRTIFCAWKLLMLDVRSITIITILLLPVWHPFIHGFVENWTAHLLKKHRSLNYEIWERYSRNKKYTFNLAHPLYATSRNTRRCAGSWTKNWLTFFKRESSRKPTNMSGEIFSHLIISK